MKIQGPRLTKEPPQGAKKTQPFPGDSPGIPQLRRFADQDGGSTATGIRVTPRHLTGASTTTPTWIRGRIPMPPFVAHDRLSPRGTRTAAVRAVIPRICSTHGYQWAPLQLQDSSYSTCCRLRPSTTTKPRGRILLR